MCNEEVSLITDEKWRCYLVWMTKSVTNEIMIIVIPQEYNDQRSAVFWINSDKMLVSYGKATICLGMHHSRRNLKIAHDLTYKMSSHTVQLIRIKWETILVKRNNSNKVIISAIVSLVSVVNKFLFQCSDLWQQNEPFDPAIY